MLNISKITPYFEGVGENIGFFFLYRIKLRSTLMLVMCSMPGLHSQPKRL